MKELQNIVREMPIILSVYVPVAILLLCALLADIYLGVPIDILTRDPAVMTGMPFYIGWLSYLGAVLWAASASIALFSASLCKGDARKYLISIGIFAAVLMIDDLFMMHDGLLLVFGVSEKIIYLIYALAIALIIRYNRHFLLEQNYWLLFSAAFFLACSLAIDVYIGKFLTRSTLLEDGAKLLGIAGIFGHVIGVSMKSLRDAND